MSEEARVLGAVFDYPSMMAVMRARANELHIARGHEDTSDLSGLPDKYLAKLLGPRPVRRIGMKTMGAVMGVLQMKFIAVVDEEAVRRYGKRTRARDERRVHSDIVTLEFSRRFMQKIGKKGGLSAGKRMSKAALRRRALRANLMRWDRVKAVARGPITPQRGGGSE